MTCQTGGKRYDPTRLLGTATGQQHGDLTFTLLDSAGAVIGRSVLSDVSLIDAAPLTVGVR